MEKKTLSNNIPGLTMLGTADWTLEARSSGDVIKNPKYMEDLSGDTFTRINSPVGTISVMGNMPARIVSAKKTDPKLFISHSAKDKEYAQSLVKMLESIGLDNNMLFCSSAPGYGIPLGEDIYETLSNEFNKHALHVIFLLSENYYQSAASLNEMGAAWVLGQKYTSILVPGFDFGDIKGVADSRRIAIKIDSDKDEYLQRIDELKNQLTTDFSIDPIDNRKWGRARAGFREECLIIAKERIENEKKDA